MASISKKIETQNVLLKFFQNLLEIFLTLRRADDILWELQVCILDTAQYVHQISNGLKFYIQIF